MKKCVHLAKNMVKKQLHEMVDSSQNSLVKTLVLGVEITNVKKEKILEYIVNSLEKRQTKYFIVTPNPEMIVYAAKHPRFKQLLNEARIALCDGTQLFRSARFLGKQLQEKIAGVDFMEDLCATVSKKPITVGFLGGRNGVAEKTAQRLTEKYPGLKVVFAGEELPDKYLVSRISYIAKNTKEPNTKYQIPNTIDLLFVAFGFPKQEEWMFNNLSKYNVKVMMGVGGSFDYLSGKVSRAPTFIRQVGFEWLYRLIIQPWRIKRQIRLLEFIWLVIREKYKLK